MPVLNKMESCLFHLLRKSPKPIKKIISESIGNYRRQKCRNSKLPESLTLFITSKCNAKCAHCFYWKNINIPSKEELSIPQLKELARTIERPLKTLMLTGGEPFLRRDIEEICDIFYSMNGTRRITIATNGFLEESAEKMIKIAKRWKGKTLHCQLSVDGLAEVHDQIRNVPEGFNKVMSTLDKLTKGKETMKNLDVSVMTTISNINFENILSLSDFISERYPNILHKYNVLRSSHIATYGVSKALINDLTFNNETVAMVPVERLKELFLCLMQKMNTHKDGLWQNFQKLKWQYTLQLLEEPSKQRKVSCSAGYSFGVIYPNGFVSSCENLRPVSNLSDYDFNFKKLWHSEEMEDLRTKTQHCECIHPCNVLASLSMDGDAIFKAVDKY